MTESQANFILNLIPGIGPIRVRRLIQHFGSAAAILAAPASRLRDCDGIGTDTAKTIADWENTTNWQHELELCQQHHICLTTPADPDYPTNLRNIPDAPICLYYKGSLNSGDSRSIAIVGSRITTTYGQNCAQKIAYQLAYAGITVVSGLARGIDTYAHRGALAARGRTIAVVGSGLLALYPPENQTLAEKIADEKGCIMSEFPLHRKPDRQSFAIRNRIVAAMTHGTVVIEAPHRSGALITANMAADYGRIVFAVPGRIDTPHSAGCHQLIKNGAKLVENAEDIISEFGYLFQLNQQTLKKHDQEENITNPDNSSKPPNTTSLPPDTLSEHERNILSLITTDPIILDTLIAESHLPPHIVTSTLSRLELKRLIRNTPAGYCLSSSNP